MVDDFVSRVAGVSALAEPARRALYLYVASQAGPVSRDEAAVGAALPRHTAKFHLDKLVDEGLLDTEYRRPAGRRGPGAGRPTKLYRRSSRELTVSLPDRRYDLAGEILAQAVEAAHRDGVPVLDALRRAAAAAGRGLASRQRTHPPAGDGAPASPLERIAAVLSSLGYEPRLQSGALVLVNCPFHALASAHTALVCGMNLDLVTSMLDEIGLPEMEARLDPEPGRCCVTLGARLSDTATCPRSVDEWKPG